MTDWIVKFYRQPYLDGVEVFAGYADGPVTRYLVCGAHGVEVRTTDEHGRIEPMFTVAGNATGFLEAMHKALQQSGLVADGQKVAEARASAAEGARDAMKAVADQTIGILREAVLAKVEQ